MKELLQQYASYHLWANGLLLDAVDQLPAGQQHRELASSFNSFYKTILQQ